MTILRALYITACRSQYFRRKTSMVGWVVNANMERPNQRNLQNLTGKACKSRNSQSA
jgi:hypothetical protein